MDEFALKRTNRAKIRAIKKLCLIFGFVCSTDVIVQMDAAYVVSLCSALCCIIINDYHLIWSLNLAFYYMAHQVQALFYGFFV